MVALSADISNNNANTGLVGAVVAIDGKKAPGGAIIANGAALIGAAGDQQTSGNCVPDESTADIEAGLDEEDDGSSSGGGGKRATTGRSGIFGSIANLVNTIIGSGVLALPSCAARAGWALTIILLVLSGFVTWVGVHYLTEVARMLGGGRDTSFGLAAARTYPWLIVIVDLCVWAVSFGLCVAYLTIASSTIPYCVEQFAPALAPNNVLLQTWFWLLLCWLLVALPLSMLRSVAFLGYTSALAILCVLYTTTVVVLYVAGVLDPCAKDIPAGQECRGPIVAFTSDVGAVFVSVPVFFTAFCCSPSIFNIYNAMHKPTRARLNIATVGCVSICWVLYVVIALCGYFTYGSNVESNVLNSYPVETFATVARLGTSFIVTVSFPLLMHPARDAIVDMVVVLSRQRLAKHASTWVFYTVGLVLNIAAAAIAYFDLDLDVILSITGSFGVVNLSLTIPFALFARLYDRGEGESASCGNIGNKDRWDVLKRRLCVPGMIFGFAMSVVCAYFSLAPLF